MCVWGGGTIVNFIIDYESSIYIFSISNILHIRQMYLAELDLQVICYLLESGVQIAVAFNYEPNIVRCRTNML